MSRNAYGHVGHSLPSSAHDWGKDRKYTSRDVGMKHSADRSAIAEQVADLDDPSGSV